MPDRQTMVIHIWVFGRNFLKNKQWACRYRKNNSMIKYFGKLVPAILSLTDSWCLKTFLMRLVVVLAMWVFYVDNEMCQLLKDLHIQYNNTFQITMYKGTNSCIGKIFTKYKIDQWILIWQNLKKIIEYFQLSHCRRTLRNYHVLIFGIVSKKNIHNNVKRPQKCFSFFQLHICMKLGCLYKLQPKVHLSKDWI